MKIKTFIARVFISAIAGVGTWFIFSAITTGVFCIMFDMYPSADDYEKHWLLLSVLIDGYILAGIVAYLLTFSKLCDNELK